MSERLVTSVYMKILQENTASSVSYRIARPQVILLAARCPVQKKRLFFYTFANLAPEIAQLQNQTHVLETYPDVQKVALGVENDHIRDKKSQVFFEVPESLSERYRVSRSRISMRCDILFRATTFDFITTWRRNKCNQCRF